MAITAELPKRLADTGFATAVHAKPNARRQPLGLDQQWRQRRGQALGFLARAVPALRLTGIEELRRGVRHGPYACCCLPRGGRSSDERLAQAIDHLRERRTLRTGGEVQRHAMTQDRMRESDDIVHG